MTSHHPRRGAVLAVLAGFALLAGGLASPATAATSTATIKGVVTLEGAPVPFARVQLYRDVSKDVEHSEFIRVKTANADAAGRYTLSKVSLPKPPKDSRGYRVVVTDRPGNVVKTIRVVKPRKGKTVTRNVATSRAAVVTGKVARADGGDVRDLEVDLQKSDETINDDHVPAFDSATNVTVAADGTFEIGGVAPESYSSLVVSGGPYGPQCYDFIASSLADCVVGTAPQRFTLVPGERRAIAPVTATKLLPPPSTFSGRVTNTSGAGLKGVSVSVQSVSGEGGASGVTDRDGRFTFSAIVPAATYRISFFDSRTWTTRYPGTDARTVVPNDFVATPGQTVSGLDATLKSKSSMKFAVKGGVGTAKVAFKIKRIATGSAPGGTVTLTDGQTSRTVAVKKGRATVTLTGLAKGERRLVATYSGTSSTAGLSRSVAVKVK